MSSSWAPASPASPAAVRATGNGAERPFDRQEHGATWRRQHFDGLGQPAAGGKSPRAIPAELYDFVMSEGVGYPDLVRAWSRDLRPRHRLVDELRRRSHRNRAGQNLVGSGERHFAGAGLQERRWHPRVYKLKERFDKTWRALLKRVGAESLLLKMAGFRDSVRTNRRRPDRAAVPLDHSIHRRLQRQQEMFKRYIGPHADQCKLRGSKQYTGDGLRMAIAVGAKAVNLKYFYGHLISRKALVDDRFWPYPRFDSFVDEGILHRSKRQPFCRRRPRRRRRRQRIGAARRMSPGPR